VRCDYIRERFKRLFLLTCKKMGVFCEQMADTREEILEAAWDLFAKKGFESVSVRDVITAAGVNLASVSYHFGGKDGLIQETVKRCLNPMYEYGIKLLKDAEKEYGSLKDIPVEHLVKCWLRPLLIPEECGVRFDIVLRLTARYMVQIDYTVPSESQRLLKESYESYVKAFKAHLPNFSEELIMRQLIFAQGAALYSGSFGLGLVQLKSGKKVSGEYPDRELLLEQVVECSVPSFIERK